MISHREHPEQARMHQIDCLILDQACGMFGCCGQLDISKYLGTLGLSTKPVTNGRSNAVRLKGQRGLLSDIWQRGRHGTLAGTEDVFAADEPVWCGSGSGREIISVHYWYPIVWASGVGRKPRTNERRLDAHTCGCCGPERPNILELIWHCLAVIWCNYGATYETALEPPMCG